MLVAKIPAQDGVQEFNVGVIGSCRVHGPMRSVIDDGQATFLARANGGYSHTPEEALQQLEFSRGEKKIPDDFAPFIFSSDVSPELQASDLKKSLSVSCIVFEISAFRRISCGEYFFQENYFAKNFVRKGGIEYLDWWRDITREDTPDEATVVSALAKKTDASPVLEEILRATTCHEQSDEEFVLSLKTLVSEARVPVVLVPHFSYDTLDNPNSRGRLRNQRIVRKVAEQAGAGYFDSSELIASVGREKALANEGKDVYHFSESFNQSVGPHLIDQIRATTKKWFDSK